MAALWSELESWGTGVVVEQLKVEANRCLLFYCN